MDKTYSTNDIGWFGSENADAFSVDSDAKHSTGPVSFPQKLMQLLNDSERGSSCKANPHNDGTSCSVNSSIALEANSAEKDDKKTDIKDAISWNHNGTAFFIYDHDALVPILKQYFGKLSKFKSFQRQLQLYGFHRDRVPKDISHAISYRKRLKKQEESSEDRLMKRRGSHKFSLWDPDNHIDAIALLGPNFPPMNTSIIYHQLFQRGREDLLERMTRVKAPNTEQQRIYNKRRKKRLSKARTCKSFDEDVCQPDSRDRSGTKRRRRSSNSSSSDSSRRSSSESCSGSSDESKYSSHLPKALGTKQSHSTVGAFARATDPPMFPQHILPSNYLSSISPSIVEGIVDPKRTGALTIDQNIAAACFNPSGNLLMDPRLDQLPLLSSPLSNIDGILQQDRLTWILHERRRRLLLEQLRQEELILLNSRRAYLYPPLPPEFSGMHEQRYADTSQEILRTEATAIQNPEATSHYGSRHLIGDFENEGQIRKQRHEVQGRKYRRHRRDEDDFLSQIGNVGTVRSQAMDSGGGHAI